MKNLHLRAMLHALSVGVYVTIISIIINNGDKIFGKMDNFFGPLAFLLLFVLSAAITGSLVIGKPILMYLDNKKKEALSLFIYTIIYLFVLTIFVFGLQIVM